RDFHVTGVQTCALPICSRAEPRVVAGVSLLNARGLIETPITDKSSFMLSGRRSYIDKLIGREHPVEGDDGRLDTLRTGYYFYDKIGRARGGNAWRSGGR